MALLTAISRLCSDSGDRSGYRHGHSPRRCERDCQPADERNEAVKKAETLEIRDGLIRDEQLSGIPVLHRLLLRWSGVEKFNQFLAQAGVRTKPGKLLLLCAVLGFGSYFVDFTILGQLPVRLGSGLGGYGFAALMGGDEAPQAVA